MDGVAAFVPVEVRGDLGDIDGLVIGQKAVHHALRIDAVVGGERDLHPVAGGEDHGLGHTVARLEIGQRLGQRVFPESETLANLDGRGFVAHSGDQQLHCFKSIAPSRAWAAQVSAERQTTVTVMIAAFRPRHPAVVCRKMRAR